MDGDQLNLYRMLLDIKEIDPTPEELKANPNTKSYWPPLPASLIRLHDRFALYFKRAYNRDVERAHLPMLAALAGELDTTTARMIEKPETKKKVA